MSLDAYIYRERPKPQGSPLFFAFHGTGGDENQFFGLAAELAPDAHVIALRGDVSEHGAARFFRRKAEGVYDTEDLARRTQKMAGFVEAHRARLDPPKVIGLGYSNGANILTSTALADPELFEDVVLMHPLIPWRPRDDVRLKHLRILVTAGRSDPICPAPLTLELAAFWRRNAEIVDLEWHPGGHELRSTELDAAARFLASGDSQLG